MVLLILSGWLCTALYAQNLLDEKGRKTGPWKVEHPNGETMYEATFREGRPVGLMVRYDDKGRVTARMMFDSSKNHCFTTMFHENGKKAAEGWYMEKKKDSVWTYYSGYDGSVRIREDYNDGALHGNVIRYYPEGNISEEVEWENNSREGNWNQYYEDGNPRLTGQYKHNMLNGPYRVYYADTVLMMSGVYMDNKSEGTWDYYDDTGALLYSLEYKGGNPVDNEEFMRLMQDTLLSKDPVEEPQPFQK